jgi:multicomponent K+:H+ antiporter subunit E
MTRLARGILPYPLLSLGLFVLWLLLNQSVSPGHLVLAVLIGLIVPRGLLLLEAPHAGIRRPGAVLRLGWRVFIDIVRSNLAVAGIILGLKRRTHTAGFVAIPLRLRNANALAVLGTIITSTPGTVWVDFDSATHVLRIHVLDLIDESDWIETIQQRYETLLLEIFP